MNQRLAGITFLQQVVCAGVDAIWTSPAAGPEADGGEYVVITS